MLAEERRETILQMLRETELCPVNALVDRLDVSRITVVRDLDYLERGGLVTRVHGGAKLRPEDQPGSEARFKVRMSLNLEKKQRIGAEAARMVRDDSTIFVDSSTTCYIFALELMKLQHKFSRLNIITNSPSILTAVTERTNLSVIATGGELNTVFNMFGGLWVIDFLDKLNFDSAFISASGVSRELNLTTGSIDIANTLKKVRERSLKVNLLADSSKLARQEMLTIFPLSKCDVLLTDDGITREQRNLFRDVAEVKIAPRTGKGCGYGRS